MSDSRPNFLVIMTDQQRGDCLSAAGHPVLLTPNMDAIGGAGVRFSRAYSTCPVCVPARRTFLTGQHPSTHGVFDNSSIKWEGPSLPGVLRDAGYQTEWVGRGMHQTPPDKRYGFDHMVFKDHRVPDDYDTFLAGREPDGGGGYCGSGVMHNDWTARSWHMDESLHATNWAVSESLQFLDRRDPSCPFFLVTSILAPHPPLVPPAFYFDRYLRQELPTPAIGDWAAPPANDGMGLEASSDRVNLHGEMLRSAQAGYFGLINHVDDQIRRLLNPVDGIQRRTDRNTVVIYVSDHGEMLGDHYRWRKSLPYEGSAHIPFMIQAPECFGLRKGTVDSTPVCIEDIMPTLLDMADVEAPEGIDGHSLLPLMRDASLIDRPYLHIETAPTYQCLTDGKEKFIWYVEDGREEFFDLTVDPREERNLIHSSSDRAGWWRGELVSVLAGRDEGFSDGMSLIAGRRYPGLGRG
ncbi:MAG TPA: sulfatase-like hydrolase/transferase [Candidatus Latescibacteria bacterium]|jgi:arylsulfatase A-like enzyme|nr:arylsulfatase [Gemmatimonadota bacterium]MDP7634368.1 sulfatase-like hydrolase/transferase [Candidatus Latescibacterota bacterium]HJN27553.1 sulfatase-like hydrolase/transferase [Candidatus Latescibacterota bacterium]